MAQFLRCQLDYIFFIYGLSFLLLAVMAYSLGQRGNDGMPWRWLVGFGLLHGVNEWLDMLALSFGDSPVFVTARLAIMGASFLCLAEFGRSATAAQGARVPGRWIALPFLAMAGLGVMDGAAGLNAAVRYSLGLAGGLWSAWALWRYRAHHGINSRGLSVAAVAMALYALAVGIVVPKAPFFPASTFNQDSFFTLTGFPIQLIRGLLASIIAVAFWQHTETVRSRLKDGSTARARKAIILPLLGAVLAGGWVATEWVGRRTQQEEKSALIGLAKNSAAGVDAHRVEALAGTEADLASPVYRLLKDQLVRTREANASTRFCYVMRKVGDKVLFLVDSEPSGSPEESPPGQVYDEASDQLRTVFETGTPTFVGPIPDRWGIWVSSVAPIVDGQGQLLAVFGVDVKASHYLAETARARQAPIWVTLFLSTLLITLFAVMRKGRQSLDALRDSREFLRTLLDAIPTPVFLTDAAGTYTGFNKAFLDFLGMREEQLVGTTSRDLRIDNELADPHDEADQALLQSAGSLRFESRMRRPDGSMHDVIFCKAAFTAADGTSCGLVGTMFDITDRKRAEDELRTAARIDKLTGLANRSLLYDRLNQALLRSKRLSDYRFAVLFIDLDGFKLINDSLGHQVGDMLLAEAARRLRQEVRAVDTVSRDLAGHTAARLGGDEFVILLDGVSGEIATATVADRVLTILSRPYILNEHEIVCTASIGIVTSDTLVEKAEDLIRDADTALYEAKQAGRARYVVFDASMRARVQARLTMENELRKALETGQLLLHYQPIVSLESGRLASFEALVRWQHPERGMISPTEFVPVAEDSGLILPIGEWVMREACRQLSAWWKANGTGNPPSISVNLSRSQLMLADLPDRLWAILQETSIPPAAVQLEITESAVMRDTQAAMDVLRELSDLGFRIHLDDFGTGYSSLACLHQFPIDLVKIDRSFIVNMDKGDDFVQFVDAIIRLARSFRISVVAEGVESPGQLSILRSLKCQFTQGFLLAKPLSVEEAAAFCDPNWQYALDDDAQPAPQARQTSAAAAPRR